jgi:hypothetical protein
MNVENNRDDPSRPRSPAGRSSLARRRSSGADPARRTPAHRRTRRPRPPRAPRSSEGARRSSPSRTPRTPRARRTLVRREELQGGAEVGEVEERQPLVVAVREHEREDRHLRLVQVEHLAEEQRAERRHRGTHRRAERPESDSSSTGCAFGSNGIPSCADRSRIAAAVASPGRESPVTSPLMSEMKTGTPAAESWPAMICNVLVLPVPVAPATSPCRFIIERGSCTVAPVSTSPPSSAARGSRTARRTRSRLPSRR